MLPEAKFLKELETCRELAEESGKCLQFDQDPAIFENHVRRQAEALASDIDRFLLLIRGRT